MTNEDKKLLAFFAANATLEEASKFQKYNPPAKNMYQTRGPGHYTLEHMKFLFAQSMLEKYKEFCSL